MLLLILVDRYLGCEGKRFAARMWQSRRRTAPIVVDHVGVREVNTGDGSSAMTVDLK